MFFAGWKRLPLPEDEAATRYEMRDGVESSDRVEWKALDNRRGGGKKEAIGDNRGHDVLAKSLSVATLCRLLQAEPQALREDARGIIGSDQIVAGGRQVTQLNLGEEQWRT